MPKRTNDWQALIFFVKQFLGEGFEVTESRMLDDRQTGRSAEVDVCIEGSLAGDDIIVSVECTDRKRPADVGWVDAMDGKHQSLPTNRLVLASKSGFTKQAEQKAKARNILLVTLEEKAEDAAVRIEKHVRALFIKTVALTPTACKMDVEENEEGLPAVRVDVFSENNVIYDAQGTALTTAQEYVMHNIKSPDIIEKLDIVNREDTDAMFIMEIGSTARRDDERIDLFLRHTETGSLQRIAMVRVAGRCVIEVAKVPMAHGQVQGVNVAWGHGTLKGKDLLVAVVEDESGRGSASLRFGKGTDYEAPT